MTVVSLPPVAVAERRRRPLTRAAVHLRAPGRLRAVVAATSACALLSMALVHLDARSDLRSEREALVHARLERAAAADHAARSTAAVATAEQASSTAATALAEAAGRVDRVRADLRTRTDQRDDLRARARAATEELTGVRSNLVAAFAELGLQGSQITALDACLNGVSRALLQLAFEDDAGAAGSLRAVAAPCDAASVALDVPVGRR